MKNLSSIKNLVLALVVTGASACASTQSAVPASFETRLYTQTEVNRIVALREGGASLAEVAAEVGGTRSDVRELERSLKAQKSSGMPAAPAFSIAQK